MNSIIINIIVIQSIKFYKKLELQDGWRIKNKWIEFRRRWKGRHFEENPWTQLRTNDGRLVSCDGIRGKQETIFNSVSVQNMSKICLL